MDLCAQKRCLRSILNVKGITEVDGACAGVSYRTMISWRLKLGKQHFGESYDIKLKMLLSAVERHPLHEVVGHHPVEKI